MNTNTEFSSDYVLDKKVEEILNIEKNLINIFGVKFPTSVDEKGSFAQIKGIKLDASTSSKLTYQMWSLNFLYRTLHKSNDQFGTFELRKKVTEVLTKVLKKLKKRKVTAGPLQTR